MRAKQALKFIRYNSIMKIVRSKSHKLAQDAPTVWAALAEFQNALREVYGVHAPAVLLYGSYARGEASADSDIDLILLYSRNIQPGQEIRQVREILSDLNLNHQILISVLPVSKQNYKSAATAFWKNVRREAVSIDRD
jgi:predicted nucleotidyltransferase